MPREMKVFEVSVDPQPDPYPFRLRFIKVDPDAEYLDEGEDSVPDEPDDDDGTAVVVSEVEDHDFIALGDPGTAGMAFVTASAVRFNDRGEQVVDLTGILRFFRRAMPIEDYIRLNDLLDRQDLHIHMDKLVEIYQWLGECYMGRPTREQRRSSNTPRSIGRRSTGSHFSPAAT